MKYIQLMARMIVGGVLIYAGFIKAVGPAAEFAAMIGAYKILPSSLVPTLATALPYLEMWIGLFVLTGYYTRPSSVAAMLLFSTFLLALASSLARGIDLVSCGCFGADSLSPRTTLFLDILLLSLSVLIYRESKLPAPFSLDREAP